MKKRSGFVVMARLIGLVKPLTGFMILSITMGLIGNLCASFITIFGGYAALNLLHFDTPLSLGWIFAAVCLFALLRGVLRYAEQSCNHFIAFKLSGAHPGQGVPRIAEALPGEVGGQGSRRPDLRYHLGY